MRIASVWIWLLLTSIVSVGQSVTGSLLGVVRDASGAVVPNAQVTVQSPATGLERKGVSGAEGFFEFPSLPPGEYALAAESSGFQKAIVEGVRLTAGRQLRVDLELKPGSTSDTITVTGSAQLIRTDESNIGTSVERQLIANVPLNGRTVDSLLRLAAGVTSSNASNPRVAGSAYWGGTKFSVDGMSFNDFANGGAAYTPSHGLATLPSIDALAEFKVDSNSQKAEYEGSASVTAVTRSGSNEYHGTLFAFNRNKAYAARNASATGLPKPPYNRNEYGATLGGRIVRNRTFFFGYLEGLKERSPRTNNLSVATAAQRAGDFTGLRPLRDPLSNAPFADNRIPESRIDPRAKALLQYVPLPNQNGSGAAGTLQNLVENVGQQYDINRTGVRLDHRLTDRDSLWFVYSRSKGSPYFFANAYPSTYGHRENGGFLADNASLTYTRVLNPATTNDFRAGYFFHVRDAIGTNQDFDARTLFPDLFGPLPAGGLPTIAINGHVGIGDYGANTTHYYTTQFIDNLTHVRGKHTIKAGFDVVVDRVSRPPAVFGLGSGVAGSAGLGVFSFDGRYTVPSGTAQPEHALADYLLGYAFRTQRASASAVNLYFQTRFSGYVQDDWKLSSRLTLNYGLRYVLQTAWKERDGAMANLNLATGKLEIPGDALPAQALDRLVRDYDIRTANRGSRSSLNTDKNNLAPRLGFALRLNQKGTLVLRGGAGFFYNTLPLNVGILQLGFSNPPYLLSETFDAAPGSAPSLTLERPFVGSGAITSSPTINAADANLRNSLSQQWNFTLEAEPLRNLAVRVSYAGNKTTHLNWYNYNLNFPRTQEAGAVQPRRPYQPWGTINYAATGGDSSYHGLQLSASRRFTAGLSFETNYGWNRSLDNVPVNGSPQDPYRADLDKGNSDQVRRHVFSIGGTYELPFGPGRRLLNRTGVLGHVVGGWQLASITLLQSGGPASVIFNATLAGWAGGRADLTGDPRLERGERNEARWFNTQAFRTPAPYTYGNSARNLIFQPGSMQFDVSLLKDIKVTERLNLQFRAESFNFPNHRNLGGANTNVSSPTFGQIFSSGDPRLIQFGLKILF